MGEVLLWGFLIILIFVGAAPIVYIIYMCLGGFKRYNDVNLARNGYSPDEIAAMRTQYHAAGAGISFFDFYTGRYRQKFSAGMKQPTQVQGQPQRDRSWEGFE